MENKNLLECFSILLKTEDAGKLCITENGELTFTESVIVKGGVGYTPQYIYLCSQREIEEGYFMAFSLVDDIPTTICKFGEQANDNADRKIEFTNNPQLISDGVPEIPIYGWRKNNYHPKDVFQINFLEEFVNRFNNKNIKEIDVKKLAKEDAKTKRWQEIGGWIEDTDWNHYRGYVRGFNKAQNNAERKWTDKDMELAIFKSHQVGATFYKDNLTDDIVNRIIKSLVPCEEEKNNLWVELHPRPITCGHTELGEEGKDYEWSVVPYNKQPIIHFDKP